MINRSRSSFIIIAAAMFFTLLAAWQPFTSGAPAGSTGAPGEGICTDCHATYPTNSGSGSVSTNAPLEYQLNETIDFTVTVSDPDAQRFGFEITAKDEAENLIGSWMLVDPLTRFAGNTQTYVTHSSSPNASGSQSYSLRWTAPSSIVGDIHFYIAGNGARLGGAANDRIYSATHTLMLAGNTATEQEEIPASFSVTDVFPNPFVSRTTLSFELPGASDVRLSVYDIAGRRVVNRPLGSYGAGSHETTLGASSLPAGILIYRLVSRYGVSTGRMILLR